MAKTSVVPFGDLVTSTMTVIVYTNITFHTKAIYKEIPVIDPDSIDVPVSKKKGDIETKKVRAPRGVILSVRKGIRYRGLNWRKSKNHWCASNCRLMKKTASDREKEVLTVVEESHLRRPGEYKVYYWCKECKHYYTFQELDKKIPNFRNQITVVVSLGDYNINIMMFETSFKIAGCRNTQQAIDAISILWEKYIYPSGNYSMREEFEDEKPRFVFQTVMRNISFRLGFEIDRQKLKDLASSEEFRDKIKCVQYESSGNTNVKIKMFTNEEYRKFDAIEFSPSKAKKTARSTGKTSSPWKSIEETPDRYRNKKAQKEMCVTFIVFSSSEIIITGSYYEEMKVLYEYFTNLLLENRSKISEVVEKPRVGLRQFLDG